MKDRLYNLLKDYNIYDAIQIEDKDQQYLALYDLYKNKKFDDVYYLFLIIINSLISFQLSGKWEKWWWEFSNFSKGYKWYELKIYSFFEDLLNSCKYNKRFISTKLKRVKKVLSFRDDFKNNYEKYYANMKVLNKVLSNVMNQKEGAKTIVFAVKMFGYGARNVFGKINYFPFDIMIPLDSRLISLYKLNFWKDDSYKLMKKYYFDLSKDLNIPPLHLDSILWVNFEFLKEKLGWNSK